MNPAVPDRQLWAIGMVVVQWGMTEFLREQITFNLMGDDAVLLEEYKRQRSSVQKTAFWKQLVIQKMQEPDRSKYLDFVRRFETLNNQRDDIIHRLWGGGMQPGSLGAPEEATTTDAALHRNRDEKMKTKSTDARANLRWRLTFSGLREIARNMSHLNSDIFTSFLPPGTPLGVAHDVFGGLMKTGQLGVGVVPRTPESDPDSGN